MSTAFAHLSRPQVRGTLTVHAALHAGKRVAFFSLEMNGKQLACACYERRQTIWKPEYGMHSPLS